MSSNNESTQKHGGCPVKHDGKLLDNNNAINSNKSLSSPSPWGSWFRTSSSSPSTANNTNNTTTETTTQKACSSSSTSTTSSGSCPIQNGSIQSIEEAAKHAQTPQPGQTIPLSTHRTISSIPKANDIQNTPNHQPLPSQSSSSSSSNDDNNNTHKWVYPSEQQFYNAMKRKGWEIKPGTESTIPFVVQIHNAVNERGWKEIKEWEDLRSNHDPKLVKFIGRPEDLSPKARLYSMLWMRKEPFDRHDWYVSRSDGSDMRRYVIDFYNGNEKTGDLVKKSGNGNRNGDNDNETMNLPSMYLDVRPALDDTDAVTDHMKMFVKDAFPGIASYLFKR